MGYWSYQLIWVRNMQDVMLAIVAPALIVLGAPWLPLARGAWGWPRGHRARGAAADDGAGEDRHEKRPAGLAVLPILVTVLFCVVWWVWHLPGPFDAALRSPAVYAAEVITYLAAASAVWLQLIGVTAAAAAAGAAGAGRPGGRPAASGTVLGLIRAYGPGVAYPAYLDSGA